MNTWIPLIGWGVAVVFLVLSLVLLNLLKQANRLLSEMIENNSRAINHLTTQATKSDRNFRHLCN